MRPLFIHNVDFIQLPLPLYETTTYFPISTHLKGKKIRTLHLQTGIGTDLSGQYMLVDDQSIFISLYNVNGDLIIDNLPINYFDSASGSNTPIINDEIDWERSFVTLHNRAALFEATPCIFLAVFFCGEEFEVPELKNQILLELDVPAGTMEISLLNKIPFLNGKKITAIYYDVTDLGITGGVQPIVSYLYLYVNDEGRYINYLPLSSLVNSPIMPVVDSDGYTGFQRNFLQNIFIRPACIDFDKSKLLIRENIQADKKIKLVFYYE